MQHSLWSSSGAYRRHALWLCIGASITLTGCQVVSVKQQNLSVGLINERDSILTEDRLSEASLNLLSATAQKTQDCISQPDQCLEDIRKIPEIDQESMLSAGSEIYLARAIQLKAERRCNPNSFTSRFQNEDRKALAQKDYQNCNVQQLDALNQSIRYSYAYLFSTKRAPEQRIFDNRQVQVRDFYNQAIASLVTVFNQLEQKKDTDFNQNIAIGNSSYILQTSQYPNLDIQKVKRLISTYNLGFSGLRSISKRDGFGSEFVIQMQNVQSPQVDEYMLNPLINSKRLEDHPNIHDALFLPATLVVEPEHTESVKTILESQHFKFRVINPYTYKDVNIGQRNFPLAANFSAPYGLWLANNNLGASAYLTLIDRQQNLLMPHLYMLEPYNPNKKVIVMIHGLASSPEAWINVTNDIMGDSVLRDQYQVWQIFYSTNMPIIESRYQIYALLKQAFEGVNAKYPNKPATHSVLIGHSMGGVISRLLVSNDDFTPQIMEFLKQKRNRNYRRLQEMPIARDRLKMNALVPPIDRAIFLSTPFHGTDYADRWFTLAARRIIKLPQSFLTATVETVKQGLTGDLTDDFFEGFGRDLLQNGPSDLSKKSNFTKFTQNAHIVPDVKYHLIIGNNTKSDQKDIITDGVVPYRSAHIEGAQSEKIIHGGHSIQYTPEAILELRRILRLHLKEIATKTP